MQCCMLSRSCERPRQYGCLDQPSWTGGKLSKLDVYTREIAARQARTTACGAQNATPLLIVLGATAMNERFQKPHWNSLVRTQIGSFRHATQLPRQSLATITAPVLADKMTRHDTSATVRPRHRHDHPSVTIEPGIGGFE